MKRLKQYFDSDTPEQAALQNLILTLITEVKQRHIDWFADVETEDQTFEAFVREKGGWSENDLYEYSLVRQARTSRITNFTVMIHDPAVFNILMESIRWDLCYGGVHDVLETTPFLFREENKALLDEQAKRCEEAGMSWQ